MLNSKSSIKEWVEKYPFLRIKDLWQSTDEDNYETCWMVNDLPQGWINAFGDQMCEELLVALGQYVDRWIILQVKEKWGLMVIYYHFDVYGLSNEEIAKVNKVEKLVSDIIDKYDEISYHTCAYCGASATRKTKGWILPICDKCFVKEYGEINYE